MIISIPNGTATRWTTKLWQEAKLPVCSPDNYHIQFRKGEETGFHETYFRKKMGKYIRGNIKRVTGSGLGKNEKEVVKQLEMFEKENIKRRKPSVTVKLSTWGGRGLLKNFSVPVIWLIRDPVQTYITAMYNHSEDFHHYCRKFVSSGEMRECTLKSWLYGPLQYWAGQFKYMMEDEDGFIVRVERFVEDFAKVFEDERFKCYKKFLFENMKSQYSPHVYNEEEELSPWIINYIRERTNEYYEWRKTWE